jgi:hypothetical protein
MTANYGSFAAGRSSVYQTVGTNTWQSLGTLTNSENLPPQSLTTIVLDRVITVGAAGRPSPTNGAPAVSLNASLRWTPGSNALTYAVYFGTSSNAVANATPASPEFQGIAATNSIPMARAGWGTIYYWRVDEIAYSNTNQGMVWSFSTAPAVQLPSPWQSQDIGGAVSQTSAIYTNGVFAVTGSGADIQNSADAFRYAYITLTGNGAIIARVSSVQNADPWSKAGVMIRASLNTNAANAFVAVTPGNGVIWQYRSSAGGGTTYNNTAGLSAPYWVKLVWSGSIFTGYRSPDGVNWTQQGTGTFTTTPSVYIGLAVTSHNTADVCMATFDNVTAPGWPLLPGTPGSLTATAGNAQVALSWSAASGASSYNLRSGTNDGGPYAVLTNVTTTVYTNTSLINGTTYLGLAQAAGAQTVALTNGVQKYASLTGTTLIMSNKCELWVTNLNPLSGCTINLNSIDAWLFLPNVKPSVTASTYLGQVQVSGGAAGADSNVRVVQFGQNGAVMIPQASTFRPLTVFTGAQFGGTAAQCPNIRIRSSNRLQIVEIEQPSKAFSAGDVPPTGKAVASGRMSWLARPWWFRSCL